MDLPVERGRPHRIGVPRPGQVPFVPIRPGRVAAALAGLYHRAVSPTSHARILTIPAFVDDLRAAVARAGVAATVRGVEPAEHAGVADALARTDIFVTGEFRSGWLTDGTGPLRLIQSPGAGTDGIDLSALPDGVTVCNVYGHEYAIAEHVFMVMAALNRELVAADTALRAGLWSHGRPLRELRGRTICIVGLGRIGRELARWAGFYGMRATGVTRTPGGSSVAGLGLAALGGLADLPRIAADADFLVNALPLTTETAGLIGAGVLAGLPRGACLVNVGRGPVVDEVALYESLRDGRLAGAAIDVWYRYPERDGQVIYPADRPFHELSNVILTPHQAGYTEGTMRHRWQAIAENIRRLGVGEPLANVVWPKAT